MFGGNRIFHLENELESKNRKINELQDHIKSFPPIPALCYVIMVNGMYLSSIYDNDGIWSITLSPSAPDAKCYYHLDEANKDVGIYKYEAEKYSDKQPVFKIEKIATVKITQWM